MLYTAHYWFIVTFRGANFWHGILMPHYGIAKHDFRLRSRKVRENHITVQEAQFRSLNDRFSQWRPAYIPFLVNLCDVSVSHELMRNHD